MRVDEFVAKFDFKGAAIAQAVVDELEKRLAALKPSKLKASDLLEDPAAAHAQINQLKILEEQLIAKKEAIDNLVAKKNFTAAAAAQVEEAELEMFSDNEIDGMADEEPEEEFGADGFGRCGSGHA